MNLRASNASATNSRPKNSDHRRIFQCDGYGDCSMSFTRAEHLARHIRKHTGDRPFKCDVCHKFFSRADNLRQHRDAVHAGRDANARDRSSSSTVTSHMRPIRPHCRKSRLRNSTQSCPQLYPPDLQPPHPPKFSPNVSHDISRNDSMDLPALTSLALLPTPGSYGPSQKYPPWFLNPDMPHMSSGPRLSGLPPLGIRDGAVSAATTTPTVPPATCVNAQYPLNSYVGTNLPIIYSHTPLRRARSLNSYSAVWAETDGLFTAGPQLPPEEQAVASYILPQQQQQQLIMVPPQTHTQAPPQSHPEHGFNPHGAL